MLSRTRLCILINSNKKIKDFCYYDLTMDKVIVFKDIKFFKKSIIFQFLKNSKIVTSIITPILNSNLDIITFYILDFNILISIILLSIIEVSLLLRKITLLLHSSNLLVILKLILLTNQSTS